MATSNDARDTQVAGDEEALILTEPDIRIIDLAFDSGFDSQEAFTRAFAKAFGHPPARLRSLGPVSSMMRRKKASTLEPEIHERVELMPDLHLAAANAAYVNYIGDEGRDGVRAAYGEHKLLRLAALKAKFDPRNLFRMIRTSSPQRADHSGAHGLSGESHSGLTAARCWDRTSS
jgi:hypothetical protein